MIDDTDRKILSILQQDARASNTEIAQQVGMAPSAVFERIKKLEKRGVIQGYEARITPENLNLGLLAYVFVRGRERFGSGDIGKQLAELPEVLEVHSIAGEDCYLVKVRAAGTEALYRILRERFGAIPEITSTRTTIVLSTVKESAQLEIRTEAARQDELID
jgi:Lrp/AsnC family leucine-responsive transcriptional regulator